MDAAFRLGSAAPTAGALIFAGRGPAAARHTPNREITRCDKWMLRQFCEPVDRLDFLPRNIRERIELQPRAVVLDDGNLLARAAQQTPAPHSHIHEALHRL